MNCEHQCSGNCRRVGCNCECGEFHEYKERAFSAEQIAQIRRMEYECVAAHCEGEDHKCMVEVEEASCRHCGATKMVNGVPLHRMSCPTFAWL